MTEKGIEVVYEFETLKVKQNPNSGNGRFCQ